MLARGLRPPANLIGGRFLFQDRFVVGVDPDNDVVGESISMEEFSSLPYLATSCGHEVSPAEAQLDLQGIARNTEVTTGFGLAPILRQGTNRIAVDALDDAHRAGSRPPMAAPPDRSVRQRARAIASDQPPTVGGLTRPALGAVVLHAVHDGLPLTAAPATGVTAVGPRAVAEADGPDFRDPPVERRVAGFLTALHARLHVNDRTRSRPIHPWGARCRGQPVFCTAGGTQAPENSSSPGS